MRLGGARASHPSAPLACCSEAPAAFGVCAEFGFDVPVTSIKARATVRGWPSWAGRRPRGRGVGAGISAGAGKGAPGGPPRVTPGYPWEKSAVRRHQADPGRQPEKAQEPSPGTAEGGAFGMRLCRRCSYRRTE